MTYNLYEKVIVQLHIFLILYLHELKHICLYCRGICITNIIATSYPIHLIKHCHHNEETSRKMSFDECYSKMRHGRLCAAMEPSGKTSDSIDKTSVEEMRGENKQTKNQRYTRATTSINFFYPYTASNNDNITSVTMTSLKFFFRWPP